jgi:ABC-type lipoprotein release transport system permease subunit
VDSLFGVSLTSIMVGLLLLMGLSFLVLGWIAWTQPLLVRIGIRNIRRRMSQTVLIVIGLMLSTLIVSAAFATGDTVGFALTDSLYKQLEEVDFLIVFDENEATGRTEQFTEVGFLEALRAQFASDPDVDGITGLLARQLPVLNADARLSEPSALVVGVDPGSVDTFNSLRRLDGTVLSASALSGNDAFITERLSEEINAGAGDSVTIFFENAPAEFNVLDVIHDSSVTNQGNTEFGGMAINLDTARTLFGEPDSLDLIAVSSIGGVRDTLDISDQVKADLEAFIDTQLQSGAEVSLTKKEVIELGELVGSVFVTIFLIFGLFSISAGIMLIFLIFIMLAAERRSEMGIARAVGMSRLNLTQTYIAEGMAYNVGSAMVGAILGLGVAWLLIFILGRAIDAEAAGFSFSFQVNPQGFVIAYAAGVTITFITVALSAWRAANLNIVRAIRDLPEPQLLTSRDPSWSQLWRVSVGALWTVGWVALIAFLAIGTFNLFIFSLTFFGIPFLVVIPVALLYILGLQRASSRGRGPLFWFWLVLLIPITLPTLGLITAKPWADRHRNGSGWAVVMLLLGIVFIYLGGWQWGQAFAYASGTTLAVFAIAMLAVYWYAPSRPAFTIASLGLVWYWLLPLPFSLIWEGGKNWTDPLGGILSRIGIGPKEITGNIEMFFVSGICITAAATIAIVFNASFFLGLVSRSGRFLGGAVPAIRTAVAYPLAAQFRTGITLAMFGLVVFSLVVMAYLNFNFSQLFLGAEASAGFDVIVRGNPSNRIDDLDAELTEGGYDVDASVTGIGRLVTDLPQFRQDSVTGFENSFFIRGGDQAFFDLAALPLQTRATGYDSDTAVFEAIQSDATLVVASADILDSADGPFGDPGEGNVFKIDRTGGELEEAPWQPIALTARDAETGATQSLTLIGILEPQLTGVLFDLVGVIGQVTMVEQLTDGGAIDSFFLTTVDGSKSFEDTTAKGIESTLLERGVQATSIEDQIDSAAAQSQGFQMLFEGFMGLGLIVGIAALGVIAFRTVVERRQQIGMLRAIGYSRRLVAASFFLESSFIALTGIAMGVVLGSGLSYNLLTSPEFTDGTEIDFQVPWLRLAIIVSIAYVASALMTLWPARSASHVPVAEALRYE